MKLCSEDNIHKLKLAYQKQSLFSKRTDNEVILLILEVLKNALKNRKCADCFSKKVKRALKRQKTFVGYLLKKSVSLKKKRKKIQKASMKQKRAIKKLVKEFFSNCTEICSDG